MNCSGVVRYTDWKLEGTPVLTWRGMPRGLDNMHAFVSVVPFPPRFEAKAFIDGMMFYSSEHACLCAAKAAVEEAFERAHALREVG